MQRSLPSSRALSSSTMPPRTTSSWSALVTGGGWCPGPGTPARRLGEAAGCGFCGRRGSASKALRVQPSLTCATLGKWFARGCWRQAAPGFAGLTPSSTRACSCLQRSGSGGLAPSCASAWCCLPGGGSGSSAATLAPSSCPRCDGPHNGWLTLGLRPCRHLSGVSGSRWAGYWGLLWRLVQGGSGSSRCSSTSEPPLPSHRPRPGGAQSRGFAVPSVTSPAPPPPSAFVSIGGCWHRWAVPATAVWQRPSGAWARLLPGFRPAGAGRLR
mmetsp:Transcript_93211/g.272841  ORF Transcript_93211/g.272841 Transcript_93211/m.272841 type:complete len:270 (+) Transcript_93211:875-1684(+)